MKLQFDANQSFQLAAVQAVVGLFEGQPGPDHGVASFERDSATSLQLTEKGIGNRCVLAPGDLLKNLQRVQQRQNVQKSLALEVQQLSDMRPAGTFPNYTVEMETGTGKTYVYLRTIYELNKTYGFKKFVVVVPSIAIREGVLKSLEITREHFRMQYDYPSVEYSVYDSSRVNQLRNFALSNALQILVINIDAFAKESEEDSKRRSNVINQVRETGVKPIEFIQTTNPVVILDEPQNLETDNRKRAIARLNPLCALRYSATHRNTYNLIYRLDPVRAYTLGLVKQISVDSVVDATSVNQAFIEVEQFQSSARSISAKASIWVNQASGPKKKRVTLRNGDSLFELSGGREIYRDNYIVNEIDAEQGFVRFANNVTAHIGVAQGNLTEAVLKLQIEATVRRHFEKARALEPQGIKVLSVFFLDRVSSYRVYNPDGSTTLGHFGRWFEEVYEQFRGKPEFRDVYSLSAQSVHNGYFAQDKRAVSPYSESEFKTKADAEGGTFELIMRDKERLLDIAEPLRFIFSHSALREGWDNPNVFQICTLAEAASEIRKRQEIGRGLRLCVNQKGERIFDRSINRLTVIANETYEDFARQLQSEMEQDGVEFKREMMQNERDKVQVTLRKGYQADPAFKELWERIRQRTRYRVRYSTTDLTAQSAKAVAAMMKIERPRVVTTRADLESMDTRGLHSKVTNIQSHEVEAKFVIPDLIGQVQEKTRLSRSTVAQILLQSGRLQDALNNPQLFVDKVSENIDAVKRRLLVDGVEYRKIDGLVYEMRRFEGDDLRTLFLSNIQPVGKPEKTLFSHIEIDSNSGPERHFAKDCEDNDDVLFYIKLPRWFEIETPVGAYRPDWAVMYQGDSHLYFVAETKDTGTGLDVVLSALLPIEQMKIECGKRHFENFEEVRFRVVKTLAKLVI